MVTLLGALRSLHPLHVFRSSHWPCMERCRRMEVLNY